MATTAFSPTTRSRVTSTPPPTATRGAPSPARLSAAQLRELEFELDRELAALERRLVIDRQAESFDSPVAAGHDSAMASDTVVRRDAVAAALARLAAAEYGTCMRCGEAIPYGRLLVMPEATHCLRCSGRA